MSDHRRRYLDLCDPILPVLTPPDERPVMPDALDEEDAFVRQAAVPFYRFELQYHTLLDPNMDIEDKMIQNLLEKELGEFSSKVKPPSSLCCII